MFKLILSILKNEFPSLKSEKEIADEMASYKEYLRKSKILKDKIYQLIVDENYTVNHLQHYTFIIDGSRDTYGICELLGIFGDNVFFKADIDRKKKALIESKERDIKEYNEQVEIFQS